MVMRRARLAGSAALVSAALVAAGVLVGMPAAAAPPLAPLSPSLQAALAAGGGSLAQTLAGPLAGRLPVLVHGRTLADAERAVEATGMQRITEFRKIGVVVAAATTEQVDAARGEPGVTYLEGDQPLDLLDPAPATVPQAGQETVPQAPAAGQAGAQPGSPADSHVTTRSVQARQTLVDQRGNPLDGTGVTIAVIDTGVDATHPAFAGGKVVRSLKSLCVDEASTDTSCVMSMPASSDTDTLSVGGHGTHVASIAAGRSVTLADGTEVAGAAPGASIVSLSTGAVLAIIGSDAAMNWVLENHRAPCGSSVPAAQCPPIKVINNSYGPAGGGSFDPNSATVKLQRQLAAEGVVTVWAAGNDGGDGVVSLTNPPGQDPTGGIISVASYNDQGTGTRTGMVSSFSSRGSQDDPSTWPDISAPGENIIGACRLYLLVCSTGLQPRTGPGLLGVGAYNSLSGSSMAAPHVAGIVAQLFQAAPRATPAQIEAALKATATRYEHGAQYRDVDGYTTSFDKGAGLVDAVAAAEAVGAQRS